MHKRPHPVPLTDEDILRETLREIRRKRRLCRQAGDIGIADPFKVVDMMEKTAGELLTEVESAMNSQRSAASILYTVAEIARAL